MPEDSGQKLRPATREEVMESLAYALRYQRRRRVRDPEADSFMARVAAEGVVQIRVTREAGLTLPRRMIAPSRFQRWCGYGPKEWRSREAARA